MELKAFLEEQKAKCQKRLDEIDKELEDIKAKNEASEDEAELKELGDSLAELEAEKVELIAELKEVEAQIDALDQPKEPEGKPEGERAKFLQFEKREGKNNMNEELRKQMEERATKFKETGKKKIDVKELRAVTIASGTIATPTEVNPYINPTFNQVSSIVDLVKVTNAVGMGAYEVAYETAIGTASAQTEGQAITESNPTYAYKTITPASYGIVSYITNQVMKQSPLDYEGKIVDSAEKSLRVKAANIITSAIVSDTLLAKPAALNISAIDDTTLRKIAFNYGSDETIYGNAWLFLTKADLVAFGDVRSDTTLQAVYEITPDINNPNTGTIKDGGLTVRYCLNPNLTALASASANGVSMLYGQPENFELALFSDYEVKVSEDYAFTSNMLTIRGTMDLGGAVVKKDGFIAVTKAA
ncbi:MAG: phage major capsid protein [Methanobrevibacter sp.]|nr:phage major capsid protein [Methanobrevibacter sp.]